MTAVIFIKSLANNVLSSHECGSKASCEVRLRLRLFNEISSGEPLIRPKVSNQPHRLQPPPPLHVARGMQAMP